MNLITQPVQRKVLKQATQRGLCSHYLHDFVFENLNAFRLFGSKSDRPSTPVDLIIRRDRNSRILTAYRSHLVLDAVQIA